MPEEIKSSKEAEANISDYLTEEERRKLLASLHKTLVWVGVKEPEECLVDKDAIKEEMLKYGLTEREQPPEVHPEKGTVDLHHLIWRLINEKEITDTERRQIEELIDLLGKKEKHEEEILAHEKLTCRQAREIHDETAGILRTLIDLKDILKKQQREFTGKSAKAKAKEIRDYINKYVEPES